MACPLKPGGQEGGGVTTCHVWSLPQQDTRGQPSCLSLSSSASFLSFPGYPLLHLRPLSGLSRHIDFLQPHPTHLTLPSLPPSAGPGGLGGPVAAPGPGKTWFSYNMVELLSTQPSLPSLPTQGSEGRKGLGGAGGRQLGQGHESPLRDNQPATLLTRNP